MKFTIEVEPFWPHKPVHIETLQGVQLLRKGLVQLKTPAGSIVVTEEVFERVAKPADAAAEEYLESKAEDELEAAAVLQAAKAEAEASQKPELRAPTSKFWKGPTEELPTVELPTPEVPSTPTEAPTESVPTESVPSVPTDLPFRNDNDPFE